VNRRRPTQPDQQPARRPTSAAADATDTPPTPDPGQRRAAALRQAAAAKHQAAVGRAEAGPRRLVKDRADINFRSVAKAAGVSLDFLYTHPELRPRIERLRAQQRASPSPAAPAATPADGNVLRTLASQLTAERARHREKVDSLETRLAAAHGEILTRRRRLHAAGLTD
jgi:hypothetical protein